jgi:hypothetical protein
MSARLSRRYGRVCFYPPISTLRFREQTMLGRLTGRPQTEFEDLPERYQGLILEAEATHRRYVEAFEAGDTRTMREIDLQAHGLAAPAPAEHRNTDLAPAAPGRPQDPTGTRAAPAVTGH